MSTFYDLEPLDNKGEKYPFKSLEGKVVLVVNVASKCGFTPQYDGLEKIYKKYGGDKFEILGFPCNQFGFQEPGTNEDIQSFCKLNYGVSFPVLSKIDVNGSNTSPVYNFLKTQKSGLLGLSLIKWNFEKFLVDKHGNVFQRYGSMTKPADIEKDIETLLAQD